MKRTIREYASQGRALLKKHWQYDLTSDEAREQLQELMAGNVETAYHTITRLYRAGVLAGYRMRMNEERRNRHAGTFNS